MDRLDLSIPVATIGTSTNARLTFGPEEVKNGTACSTSVLVPGPADTGAQCGKISRQIHRLEDKLDGQRQNALRDEISKLILMYNQQKFHMTTTSEKVFEELSRVKAHNASLKEKYDELDRLYEALVRKEKDRRNRPNMKDYRGQRQRFQNKFNDINNGNEPEIDMFSEAQAFMS